MLNGSPKPKQTASAFFLHLLKFCLSGHSIQTYSLRKKQQYDEIFALFQTTDVLILSSPLYVDGMPSHVLDFMTKAEVYCKKNPCSMQLYALSNSGYIEGIQNKHHLNMYSCWCTASNVQWGGGVGIGGGIMLRVLSLVFPIILGVYASILLLHLGIGNPLTWDALTPFFTNLAIYLFLNSGVLYSLITLSKYIKKRGSMQNLYTRVMIPSFLFLPIASAFMALSFLGKKKT